jgi:hypothetical protein
MNGINSNLTIRLRGVHYSLFFLHSQCEAPEPYVYQRGQTITLVYRDEHPVAEIEVALIAFTFVNGAVLSPSIVDTIMTTLLAHQFDRSVSTDLAELDLAGFDVPTDVVDRISDTLIDALRRHGWYQITPPVSVDVAMAFYKSSPPGRC